MASAHSKEDIFQECSLWISSAIIYGAYARFSVPASMDEIREGGTRGSSPPSGAQQMKDPIYPAPPSPSVSSGPQITPCFLRPCHV